MKKKILFIVIISLFSTGCVGSKEKISYNQFIEYAAESEFEIQDKTKALKDPNIKKVILAKKSDEYQIEFYKLKGITEAIYMFNDNRKIFKTSKNETSTYTYTNLGNYSVYSLTNESYYMYLCRVDNTLLYVKVPIEYKDEIIEFSEKIGY